MHIFLLDSPSSSVQHNCEFFANMNDCAIIREPFVFLETLLETHLAFDVFTFAMGRPKKKVF